MPHIAVKMWPGRSEESKRELAEGLAKEAARILHADISWISVTVEDVDSALWDEQVVKPEIIGKRDVLYVVPAELSQK